MALNPATPAVAVAHVLDLVDMVLVMTVNPGFGGQDYIATMEPKIAEVARDDRARRASTVDIEVDGGIAPDTVAGAAAAGANVLRGRQRAVPATRRACATPSRSSDTAETAR